MTLGIAREPAEGSCQGEEEVDPEEARRAGGRDGDPPVSAHWSLSSASHRRKGMAHMAMGQNPG